MNALVPVSASPPAPPASPQAPSQQAAQDKLVDGHDPQLYRIRHTLAHVMAQAVLEQFPAGKIAIGPPVEDGFYYDFDLPRPLTPDDLALVEKRVKHILKQRHPLVYREVAVEEARQLFDEQPYKLELIDALAERGAAISTYRHDAFEDLCQGPHVEHLGQINPKAFKLLNVAGAYWRGDEKRPMLQRIYGTAWRTPQELQAHLARLEEAKQRDHRRIGQALNLFSTEADEMGSGLILWHPKGARIRHEIEMFWRQEHYRSSYELVASPHIGRGTLWQTSGHLDFYADGMYAPLEIDEQEYYLKPMNCPFHILIYKDQLRSYREFPIRWAEWGTVYRYERSGTLHGLLRVRGFTQDDAHHFVRSDPQAAEQMAKEIRFVLDFSLHILRSFGFHDFHAYLSTQPEEKSVGSERDWRAAEAALEAALEEAEMPYSIDAGGGAFYGPKIDLNLKDAIGREWQLSTIQFDFNLPERFDLTYIGPDGEAHRPYMLHRALLGSLERFFGILVEHYAGAFPVWLSPVQAVLVPIAERHLDYADQVAARLKKANIRVEIDGSSDRMNNKIRKAQEQKAPYILVLGDREMQEEKVAVRLRSGEQLEAMRAKDFVALVEEAVLKKE